MKTSGTASRPTLIFCNVRKNLILSDKGYCVELKMAQNEKTLWDILNLLNGKRIAVAKHFNKPEDKKILNNAAETRALKGNLVLRHAPQDIEGTIYFMKHRGYLDNFGYGILLPEVAMFLTDKALNVIREEKLPEDEEKAFQQALWDITNPKFYGMGFNFGELWRRTKKRFKE